MKGITQQKEVGGVESREAVWSKTVETLQMSYKKTRAPVKTHALLQG